MKTSNNEKQVGTDNKKAIIWFKVLVFIIVGALAWASVAFGAIE